MARKSRKAAIIAALNGETEPVILPERIYNTAIYVRLSVEDNNYGEESDSMIVSLKNLINDFYAKDISRKINTSLETKQHRGSMVSRGYPLTGILKCGYCNHNLARVTVKQPYFSCHMARFEEKSPCSHVRVQEKEFSGILLAVICKQVEAVLLDGKKPSEFTLTNH